MKKILVVVDYQNDFVKGTLGFDGAALLDEGIANKVREYGEGNVYYTLDTHYNINSNTQNEIVLNYLNTREGKALPVEHCIRLSEGWEVYGETGKALKEVNATSIEKVTFGIDPATMHKTFNLLNVDEIELVGLVTNMCVVSNCAIFQAKFPEAQIVVDASLCDSFNKELHLKSLDVMEGMQVKVINR